MTHRCCLYLNLSDLLTTPATGPDLPGSGKEGLSWVKHIPIDKLNSLLLNVIFHDSNKWRIKASDFMLRASDSSYSFTAVARQ
jgi:hypothetical protein